MCLKRWKTFFFGKDKTNKEVKKQYKRWLRGERGVFILGGGSSAGKSKLLCALLINLIEKKKYLDEEVKEYSGEEIEAVLVSNVRNGMKNTDSEMEQYEFIIIEGADTLLLNHKPDGLKETFVKLLKQWEYKKDGTKRLIIVTVNTIAFLFDTPFTWLWLNPVPVTKRIVKAKAKEYELRLTKEEMKELLKIRYVNELDSALVMVKLKKRFRK